MIVYPPTADGVQSALEQARQVDIIVKGGGIGVFEAVGAGACVLSDIWVGLEEFLEPQREVFPVSSVADVGSLLPQLTMPKRMRSTLASHGVRPTSTECVVSRNNSMVCYLHGFVERNGRDNDSEAFVYFLAEEPTPAAEMKAFYGALDYIQSSRPCGIFPDIGQAGERVWRAAPSPSSSGLTR